MNKYKLVAIISICLLLLAVGGSLAWYVWTSSNTSISLNVCAPQISFIGGTTLNGEGLKPVSSREKGLRKQMFGMPHRGNGTQRGILTAILIPPFLPHLIIRFPVLRAPFLEQALYLHSFRKFGS